MAKTTIRGRGPAVDMAARITAAITAMTTGDELELIGDFGLSQPFAITNQTGIKIYGRHNPWFVALAAPTWNNGAFSEQIYPAFGFIAKGCVSCEFKDMRFDGRGYRASGVGLGHSSTVSSATNIVENLYVTNPGATNRDVYTDPENAVAAICSGGGTGNIFRWNTIEDYGLRGDLTKLCRGFWLGSREFDANFSIAKTGTVSGGTFTITMQSLTTAAIAYDANAATIQAACNAAFGASTVIVTGGPISTTAATITVNQSGTWHDTLVTCSVNSGSLTGGGTYDVTDNSAAVELENSLTVLHNTVRRTGYTAIVPFAHVALIKENYTFDCGGGGCISPSTSAVRCEDVTIEDNIFVGQEHNGYQGDPGTLTDLRNLRTKLWNNHILRAGLNGIWVQGCDTVEVKGNKVYNCGRSCNATNADGAGILITNTVTATITDNHCINEPGNYQNNGICLSATNAYGSIDTVTIDGGEYVGSEQIILDGYGQTTYRENGISALKSGSATMSSVTIRNIWARRNNRCGVRAAGGATITDGGGNRYEGNRGTGSQVDTTWMAS